MVNKQIIECVPNFSEGRDEEVIGKIADEIKSVSGVKLLHIDKGYGANRTVMTFIGPPAAVVEAAFLAVKMAAKLIDMSLHSGEHSRMGATDVCPLIPVSGISMEETVEYSVQLGLRVGKELNIPVYLYEYSQPDKSRSNLSVIRSGEYEGFFNKIHLPGWEPDFGPRVMNSRSGATVIGARDFLIAYNVNLNTLSKSLASSIASDVRETGRVKRTGDTGNGEIVKDESGKPVRIPGALKEVKAIGWYIREYHITQISMNLTNYKITPLHVAFDEVCEKSRLRGVRVTGSELVGLVPLQALLDAGKYFLEKQNRSAGVSDDELIHIAVKSLGLDDLAPFEPRERVLEYLMEDSSENKLTGLNLRSFVQELSSESPAPGGGSAAALAGALGMALGNMVANLSAGKKGWEDRTRHFSGFAEKGQMIQKKLLYYVDEDSRAFNRVRAAYALPKFSDAHIIQRNEEILEAKKYASLIPYRVMETGFEAIEILREMVVSGLPACLSDAGVGCLLLKAGIHGAYMNVRINLKDINDPEFTGGIEEKAYAVYSKALVETDELLLRINELLGIKPMK